MKVFCFFVSLFCATPLWAQYQKNYSFFVDRGVTHLERLLEGQGDWQVSITPEQVTARCMSCESGSSMIISFQELSADTLGVLSARDYISAKRHVYCHNLVSDRKGRCTFWSAPFGFRGESRAASLLSDLHGDILVSEASILASGHLVTGKFIGAPDAPASQHIVDGLAFIVRTFTLFY